MRIRKQKRVEEKSRADGGGEGVRNEKIKNPTSKREQSKKSTRESKDKRENSNRHKHTTTYTQPYQ